MSRAIFEVLEAWETPDSPEALAAAMYQMKRVHRAAVEDAKSRRKPGNPRKTLSVRLSGSAMAKLAAMRETTGLSSGKVVEALIESGAAKKILSA